MGMGLIVPQIAPFVYSVLSIERPGVIFLSAQIAMPVGTFLSGYISDRTLHIRYLTVALTLMGGAGLYALSFVAPGPGAVLLAAVLWSVFMFSLGGIIPLMNVSYLQNRNEKHSFGRVRLYGTLGFTAVNAILMFFDLETAKIVQLAGVFTLLSVIFLFFVPPGRQIEAGKKSPITLRQTWKLFSSPLFLFFLTVLFCFYFSFSATEYIISDYVAPLDFPLDPVPFVWFLGTLSEIAFFFFSPRLLGLSNGALRLIALGAAAGALRFFLLTLDLKPHEIIYAQALHGIQFSGVYLGSLIYLQEKTHPQRLATAQALVTAFARAMGTGLGAYLLGNLAGGGNHQSGFKGAFIAALVSIVLLIVYVPMQRKADHFVEEDA